MSIQVGHLLDHLEDEQEQQRKILRQRVDAERVALEATIRFSRAASAAAIEHEACHLGSKTMYACLIGRIGRRRAGFHVVLKRT